jgi:hypothetical protein
MHLLASCIRSLICVSASGYDCLHLDPSLTSLCTKRFPHVFSSLAETEDSALHYTIVCCIHSSELVAAARQPR